MAYSSDAAGLRQSRTEGGVTRQFTWSTVGGMPLLLDDGAHSYVYGPSSAPIEQVDASGAVQFLRGDLLGSTRVITDAAGDAVGSASYDAFGSPESQTGVASAFGYTGNWTDPDTGLVYLRARDYDPTTGQFLVVDPAVSSTGQPYAYAGNNPLLLSDPLGLDAGAEVLAFFAGALDGATGGISSMILGAVVPGYDCFIKSHDTAFQIGSVVAQVAVAAVMIVGTLGAGSVLVAARYVGMAGLKAGVKLAAAEARQALGSAVSRLAPASARSATGAVSDVGISSANFAQTTARDAFSAEGRFGGQTIESVAQGLKSGSIQSSQVPIDVVVRQGNTLILNTRSALALERAGVPRTAWSVTDRTGMDFFERALTAQLRNNRLSDLGTAAVRITGGQ